MDKYDTLEFSRVKAIIVYVCLRNFLCVLINTNSNNLLFYDIEPFSPLMQGRLMVLDVC
jgi:hypothetical protein